MCSTVPELLLAASCPAVSATDLVARRPRKCTVIGMTLHRRRSRGFTLAELAFALVIVSGLAAVLTVQLSNAGIRTQDRTIEQGLVQLSADAVRQASYGDGLLSVEGFRDALQLPTSPEMFSEVRDGGTAQSSGPAGPSEAYWQVSVMVAPDGKEAFLAARAFSGRCVLASVSRLGAVMVSRPLRLEVCLPQADFIAEQTVVIPVPVWSDLFAGPAVLPGPREAYVGWSGTDLVESQEGASPVVLYVATAQRSSGGGAARSCSVFAESIQPPGTMLGPVQVQYRCTIADLAAGVEYSVRVTAYTDDAQSLPSPPALVVPFDVEVEDLSGEATTGEVVIEWDLGGVLGGGN